MRKKSWKIRSLAKLQNPGLIDIYLKDQTIKLITGNVHSWSLNTRHVKIQKIETTIW